MTVIIGSGKVNIPVTIEVPGYMGGQVVTNAGLASFIAVFENMMEMFSKSHIINATEVDPKQAVYEILPEGPDLVFEAAGVLEAASLTFALCRRGTRINMFGVIVPGTIPVSPADIHFTEIRMDASFSVTPAVLLNSIRLMEIGLCDPEKIISHRIALPDIHEALRVMETLERVKVVVTM